MILTFSTYVKVAVKRRKNSKFYWIFLMTGMMMMIRKMAVTVAHDTSVTKLHRDCRFTATNSDLIDVQMY